MKILITICGRGGSKGIPGKNIKPILGKPLINYTIELTEKLTEKWDAKVSLSTDDILINKYLNTYFNRDTKIIHLHKKQDIIIDRIELYNILGKRINSWSKIKFQQYKSTLPLSSKLSDGIYIIKIKTNKGNLSKKIIF